MSERRVDPTEKVLTDAIMELEIAQGEQRLHPQVEANYLTGQLKAAGLFPRPPWYGPVCFLCGGMTGLMIVSILDAVSR